MKENKISWNNEKNNLFELNILNYQFPYEKEDYDANWLTLDIKAENELGKWHKQYSCILSWEIKWFAKWLEKIAQGLTDENEMSGYEPDLQMKYIGKTQNKHNFEINLKYGFSFYDIQSPLKNEDCIISVVLTNEEIIQSINCFCNWGKLFPPRGEIGEKMNDYYPNYLK